MRPKTVVHTSRAGDSLTENAIPRLLQLMGQPSDLVEVFVDRVGLGNTPRIVSTSVDLHVTEFVPSRLTALDRDVHEDVSSIEFFRINFSHLSTHEMRSHFAGRTLPTGLREDLERVGGLGIGKAW